SDVAPFSQHAPYQSGTGDYGGVDTKQALGSVTKYTSLAHTPAEAVHAMQLGIKHAMSGERGPVGVIFHSGCFSGRIDPNERPFLYPTRRYLPPKISGDTASIEAAARALLAAERPVIIAGNGVRIAQAYQELEQLSELIGAGVATSASGKGVFAETNDFALGVCGIFGQPTANAMVGQADLVLVVGSRLGPADTINENPQLIDPTRQIVVQIDVEPKNASWSIPCDTTIIGDAALALSGLTDSIQSMGAPSADKVTARKNALDEMRQQNGFFQGAEYSSDEVPIMPQRLFAEIRQATTDDAMITCDAGENRLFMVHYFQTKAAGTMLMPGTGAMGYSVPAALAASLVFPDRQVIAVTGDGGFSMAINGLMTARDENIPIVVVILNNSALGWVKHGQGNRPIASSFAEMNFAEIAKAMGCNGIRVEKPDELADALKQALASDKPTVVDVVTSFKQSFRDVTSPLAQS
ncbi:MAG: thiamine pyrophosphate-binding protein, partial [Alphaproteobacteria bacterium]